MKRNLIFVVGCMLLIGACNPDAGGASQGVCLNPHDPDCRNCGDGKCTAGETESSCPEDCNNGCGNGTCDMGETYTSCPADCSLSTCGNGTCDASETATSCPADCTTGPVCGNGTCEAGETQVSCPDDCGTSTCGNGTCDAGETLANCPQDCTGTCGDGICNATVGETAANCPNDCGACISGSTRLCGTSNLGVCRYGQQECVNGSWTTCVGNVEPSAMEVCDNLDNDCDGLIDNGPNCPCEPGSQRLCGSAVGSCQQGIQLCEEDPVSGNTFWGTTCTGEVGPQPESCNTLDDDCNGVADDGVGCQCLPGSTRVCGSNVGGCSFGTQTCAANGIWGGTCVGAVVASPEICDEIDNDCNGVVDEGVSCFCDPGSTRTCGSNVGSCSYGVQTCQTDGTWGATCDNQVLPVAETCNGLDDDCNGAVDDGIVCSCVPGSTRTCGTNVGQCTAGEQTCGANGMWGACNGGTLPQNETCNNLDDDCNGLVDDGITCWCQPGSTRICGTGTGECESGTQTCAADFTWGLCNGATGPSAEICDGLDNDCNGLADDSITCQCIEGEQRPCGLAVGTCRQGLQTCVRDAVTGLTAWSNTCVGSVGPSAEVCDNLDNDCNGSTDDGITCQCVAGAVRPCGSNVGSCSYGTQTCVLLGGMTFWDTCVGGDLPQPETCNGLDDDCNGAVDDGVGCQCNPGSTRPCGSAVGSCRQGLQTCAANGTWGGCVGATLATAETCNGLDDDCNGLVDDGIGCVCTPGSTRTCGSNIGACSYGTQTCTPAGVWGNTCAGEVTATAEICDGLDNDCNGVPDDGAGCQCVPGEERPCGSNVGSCSYGTQTCDVNGIWGATCNNAVLPVPETCNGLDDDCNGAIDDGAGCQCNPGSVRPCGSAIGSCRQGLQTCAANGTWGGCVGAIIATAETCNLLDDDCNGLVDDGIGCVCTPGATRTCGSLVGQCRPGVQTCTPSGVWGNACAGEVVATAEICDGLDNDCNGVPDDGAGCQCVPGEERPCGSNVGSCSYGTQTCDVNGIWETTCNGAVLPAAETCNGLDDDCNGAVDDGILCSCINGATRNCGSNTGQCQAGLQTCVAGVWGPCNGATWPAAETCNNLDDDCNGLTDDGLVCACQPGSVRLCGSNVGSCVAGSQTCTATHTWGACTGSTGPSNETCNGLDDDCNGVADDGLLCQCAVGSTRTCGSNVGTCSQGQQTCLQDPATGETYWSAACVGSTGPSAEVCDGLDNDCNGSVDDGVLCQCVVGSTRTCGSAIGVCVPGQQTCVQVGANTQWAPCAGGTGPSNETCNGLDDDCNGVADDAVGCQCTSGATRTCGSNEGACSFGIQTCVAGIWDSNCVGAIGPSAETCDGIDNDCNGVVDDGLSCQCNVGDQRVCGSSIGQCQQGIQTCVAPGVWGTNCVGAVGPSAEVCDGLDNDCNGSADDGIGCQCWPGSTRICGTNVGVCSQGTQTCLPSGLGWGACNGATGPSLEICDGLDNDCNGLTDEGVNCQCQPGDQKPCGTNVGECQAGLQDCVSDGAGGFVWGGVCVGAVGPTAEVCDNRDNDCNGMADDAVGCQCNAGDQRTCGSNEGSCSYGIQTCQLDGTWGSVCVGTVGPTLEICNGLDDDCNGSVDDGVLCQCIEGSLRPCGSSTGRCVQGTQECLLDPGSGETFWDPTCTGSVGPVAETCNGQDDDCNGVADEGCSCTPGNTRVCGNSVGQCSFGVQTCAANGTWGAACIGAVLPSAEVCDGVDNDCNGTIDEGCSCLNGSTRPCGSGVGECRQGTQTCAGGIWGVCVGSVGPIYDGPPNRCDGLDNDCNGIVDDACGCVTGTVQSCGSDEGACELGTTTCVNGFWGPCVGYIGPTAEICGDLIDQNCNGIADDPGVCPFP